MNDEPGFTKLTCTASEFGVLGIELLRKGTSLRFEGRGSSMRPLVRDGDTLLVTPCPPAHVHLGEIVMCTAQNDQLLVHRVIHSRKGADSKCYLIQGDQAVNPDGWIFQENIHGCLVAIERSGKRMVMTGTVARFLGLLVVLRQRLCLRNSGFAGAVSHFLRSLRVFADFLN